MAKNPFGVTKSPMYEDYADTFSDWQQKDDRSRWIGTGCTTEFPHNPGALEEKIDEVHDRKIIDGKY